ncbi:MAG: hypothetical protein IPM82_23475 [Saprospiraceae bacterium]|nr:hypothetical protein [Saprospiraceae bacterium]
MVSIYSAYDQIAELLATVEPEKLMKLKATAAMQKRLETLMDKSKAGILTKEEKDELDHYLVLERLVRLSKIRAQQRLLAA